MKSIVTFVNTLVFLLFTYIAEAQSQQERGRLEGNKRVGVWEFYDGQELGLRFDFDSSRIKYVRPDTARYLVQVDGNWRLVHPTRAPRLVGSRAQVVSLLQKRLRYPFQDMRNHTTGTVIVTITIDEQGNVLEGKVANAPSTTLANEVVKALEAVFLTYLPAVYQGKRVPFQTSFVVRFCFESENAGGASSRKQAALLPSPPGSFNEIIVVASN